MPSLGTKELREKAHKTMDAVPDDKLQRFVAIVEVASSAQEIQAPIAAQVKKAATHGVPSSAAETTRCN